MGSRLVALASVSISENTTSVLPARYAFLIPELAVAGLAIDSVELIGHCQQGLHVIGEPLSPLPYGLAWKPLRTKEFAGALGLRRRVFEANPEYAWFATNPEHAVRFKQRLEEEMQGEHLWHVLVKHGQVLGFYGSSVVKENPFWGPRGGVEFVLDPKLQGQGIGKEPIAVHYRDSSKKDVRCIWAQPPIQRC